ncbi:MAG: amidohydrolase family protein [bacterium]
MKTLTRRDFACLAVAGSCGSLGRGSTGSAEEVLIVDCHAHIYAEDEQKYPTIQEPKRPPLGSGTVGHLKREMKTGGVRYVTAIQTSSYYRWDNRFTVDSALSNKDFMVAVVTLDPDDSSSPGLLRKYVREYNAKGMRSVPAKSGRLDDPGVERLWDEAERQGIVINVLTGSHHRDQIGSMARRHPDLRIVIDHCFDLRVGPTMEPTLEAMRALADLPNVNAKLTFIPTGSAEPYPCRDMHDACYSIIEAFSPNRCVWGSNFPCELWCPQISYAQHLRILTHELELDDSSRKTILGKTAARLWF